MSNDDWPQSKAQEVIESLWQPYLSVGLYEDDRQRSGWCVGNNIDLSSGAVWFEFVLSRQLRSLRFLVQFIKPSRKIPRQ